MSGRSQPNSGRLQRADRLAAPPAVGQYYLVPVVTAKWHNQLMAWPVIGPAHTDAEFFNFKDEHYHIDGRFLTKRQREIANVPWRTMAGELQSAPLHAYRGESPLPKPVLTKRRCSVSYLPYEHGDKKPIMDIRAHFAGAQCDKGKGGWICPHRKASLGSVLAVDGIVVCPLHGLKIDAATGIVLQPKDGAK
jgi:hypothetical protein